jgi:hypothetical protein
MSQPDRRKFFRCPLGKLVVSGQMTFGEGWTRLPLPSNARDFFFVFDIYLRFFICIFSPFFFLYLIILFPNLGGKLFNLPTSLSFSFLLLPFSSLFFFNPYFGCWWRIWGKQGNMFLHYDNQKTYAHFLGIPLFNLLYLFIFYKMVNAWYKWYEDGKDSKDLDRW